jgi:hypothetical protein
MHAAEIVICKVQRDSGFQVCQFRAESICQSCKSANRHPHRKILPFHMRCADVVRIRIASSDASAEDDPVSFLWNLRENWYEVQEKTRSVRLVIEAVILLRS